MKILFVTTISNTVNAFLIPHIKMLINKGHQVDVAFNVGQDVKPEIEKIGCKIHIIQFQRVPFTIDNYRAYKSLKKILSKEKYDLVHTHTPVASAIARLACKKFKSVNVIYTVHGFHFFKGAPLLNWLLYYPIEKWLASHTDILITINNEDFDRAKKYKASRVEYVPGVGIDIEKFEKKTIDKVKKRESIGIKEDDFMILSIGELNKNKNHQVIIKALAKLSNRRIKYVICGQGPLRKELKELTRNLKIEDQVKFLGFRDDIPELCKAADLYAFPSFREGLSLSLMEAMVSRLPIVCSDIRGNVDLVEHGKGGYLVQPTDLNGFTEAIRKILYSSNSRKIFGDYNAIKVKDYSIDNVIKLLEQIYQEYL